MLRFGAIGRDAIGRWVLGAGAETGDGGSSPELADEIWPFDDLKPRHIGIHLVSAPIGGGVALTGREPTIDSGAGYWRIVLGGIPVKTRANILIWRGIEASLEGRGRTIAIPIYDGKRAPWPDLPGGDIDAESVGDVPEGTTTIHILPVNIADLEVGMHFSVGHRLYRITEMNTESSVVTCTIRPKAREAIPDGSALEFRRPLCMVRLADDLGMSLPLDGHKRGEATVEFVEAI